MQDDARLTTYRRNIDTLLREIASRDASVTALRKELANVKAIAAPAAGQQQMTRTYLPEAAAGARRNGRAAVVCWDLGHNPAGRAMVIYDLLAKTWQVDLVGPLWKRFGGEVWAPIAKSDRSIIGMPCESFDDFFPQAIGYAATERYDLVVVVKPRLPGLLLGAMIQKTNNCPLVLDIDDFELSFFQHETPASLEELAAAGTSAMLQPYEEMATRASETVIREFPARIVSNMALRARYGGMIVRHARDETAFHPDRFDRAAARAAMGIKDADFAIVFVGTPRPHKGIYEVARALHEMDDQRFVFHIVGEIADRRVRNTLTSFNRARIVHHPACDMNDLPSKIAAADAVALLQDPDHAISQFQIPAKISDATAFGLPVLATDVPPLRDLFPAGLLTCSSAASLIDDLAALMRMREQGRAQEGRVQVRAAFLGELGTEINAIRLNFAIAEARNNIGLPEGMERLLEHAIRTYANLRRTKRAAAAASSFSCGPTVLQTQRHDTNPPDVVMFWKQNDSELYGRRPDLLLRYMQKSGRIGRILQFDAPQPLDVLRRLVDQAAQSRADAFVLRNIVDDQLHVRDDAGTMRRTYLWSSQDAARNLFPDVGRRQSDVADYVARQIAECGIDPRNAIAWVCPVVFDFPAIAAAIPFRAIVGDLIDDQRTFDMQESYRARVVASYEETLPLLDLAITNCRPLAEAFSNLNANIHVVPNGAELPERLEDVPTLPTIEAYGRPVIGYVGNLRDRFDWSLLVATARRLPSASFVIVGGGARNEDAAVCAGVPNIHLHGPVSYDQVQACIRSFDVAIMPHLASEQTRRMNPLKIYNYVALNRPVVTSPVDNIDDGLVPYIRFAATPEEFAEAITAALSDPLTDRPGYLDAVAAISWEKRAAAVLDILEEQILESERQTG